MHADAREPGIRQRRGHLSSLIAADLEKDDPAGTQPARRGLGRPRKDLRATGTAVQRATRLVGDHVTRQEMELLRRDVGRDGGQHIYPADHRSRKGLVEIALKGPNSVPTGTRHGRGVQIGGEHLGRRSGHGQHGGDGPAARAEVDGDPPLGKEPGGPPGQGPRVRPRDEDAGIDRDADAAEHHRSGDPSQRFPSPPPGDQVLERAGAVVRRGQERLGFSSRIQEPARRERPPDLVGGP